MEHRLLLQVMKKKIRELLDNAMTKETDIGARVLVKDGAWVVPEEQRPPNWRSFKLKETVSVTTREVEMSVREQPSVERPVVVEQEPDLPPNWGELPGMTLLPDPEPEPPRKLISHIPEQTPEERELVDCTIRYWTDPLAGETAEWEECGNRIGDLAEIVKRYREAKVIVDEALTAWVERNRPAFKHLGVGSKAIQDLWITVHALLSEAKAGK